MGVFHVIFVITDRQIIDLFLVSPLFADDRVRFGRFVRINFNFKFSRLRLINLVPFCVGYIDILSFRIFRMLIDFFFK